MAPPSWRDGKLPSPIERERLVLAQSSSVIESFLKYRQFHVRLGSSYSDFFDQEIGVPQGRDVTSTKTLKYKYKYKYKYLDLKYKYRYSGLKYKYMYKYLDLKYKYFKHVLEYNSSTSTSTKYTSLPQGSILSVTLFGLKINSIVNSPLVSNALYMSTIL